MRKRILFISPFSLSNRGGGGLASLAYYNALAELFPGRLDLAMPEEGCTGSYKTTIPIPQRTRFKAILSGCLHRYKSFVRKYILEHECEYDWVILNGGFYFGDSIAFLKKKGIKILMIHHNFEKEYTITNKTILSLYGHFPYFVERNERMAYCGADINCFLTKSDQESFTKEYGECKAPCYWIGVFDPERLKYSATKDNDSRHAVITGTLSDYQTYNSIEIFEKNYFPSFLQRYPDTVLTIAGRNPALSVYRFQQDNEKHIRLIPNPEDMDEVLNENTIFICPTCSGSGQKLRIMDGLRKGMPILVHEVSSRGYEVFFDKPFFRIFNDTASFINGMGDIVRFITNNKDYKQDIIEAYVQSFSFEAGKKRMEQVVLNVE